MKSIIIFLSLILLLGTSSCATRVVTKPSSITIVKTPPKHYKVVKVKGKRYFFWNGKHYKKTNKGYVFVRV